MAADIRKSADTEAQPSAAFTPGPWQMSGGRGRETLYGHGVGPDRGPVIAMVPYSDLTPEEHRASLADARLIAAAPELLAALQLFVFAMDQKLFVPELMMEAAEKGRAALAKALGPSAADTSTGIVQARDESNLPQSGGAK